MQNEMAEDAFAQSLPEQRKKLKSIVFP